MASAIIDGTNIDTSVISYSTPKVNPAGGKVVNVYNKHFKESLTISTPLMLTWGAQEGMDPNTKVPNGKYTMALQFPSEAYDTPDAAAFLKSFREMEQKIKADALTYSKEWFGKVITSADVMEEKFNPLLRHPKVERGSAEFDYSKPPTLTVKIPAWKGVWQSEIFDEEGNPLFLKGKNPDKTPLEYLKPKTHVISLIQCGGLWFANGKVSMTWNLKQAIVQPNRSSIQEGTCFLKPKAADIELLRSLPKPEEGIDPEGPPPTTSTYVEDDEVSVVAPVVSEPVAAPEPEPVVVPERKRVIAKKKPV
jgi:hypothetical protein